MPGRCESNHDYFIRRATEEEVAATGAVHPLAREAHLEMAKRYREALAKTQPWDGSAADLTPNLKYALSFRKLARTGIAGAVAASLQSAGSK